MYRARHLASISSPRAVSSSCRARRTDPDRDSLYSAAMALLRRALAAVGIAGVIAAVLRLRGTGGTPPQSGGWRELSGPDLR